ncbi:MAG TPA: MBL fold metallo-hydrolase [Gemmatimonadaceae bacterium]|nr:MBL fold metallo-hydrolase [Gemmatimonadaceae bacterium]
MSLRLRFWGTRGSIPTPGPQTVRYGGNTPCVEVRTAENRLIVLDAGTGLRELGRALLEEAGGKPISADFFLTHAHWDHVQGVPFFLPLFAAGNRFRFWSSGKLEAPLARVIRDQMSAAVFPVGFDEVAASVEFCEAEAGADVGVTVSSMDMRHPGGALGYRLCDGDGPSAVVYVSDNELGAGGERLTEDGWRKELVRFMRGTRVLIHDATYTQQEYETHRGWGHSTYDEVVDLALDSDVGQLVLFHHKPERTDDEIDRNIERCCELVARRGGTMSVIGAAEGMQLTV